MQYLPAAALPLTGGRLAAAAARAGHFDNCISDENGLPLRLISSPAADCLSNHPPLVKSTGDEWRVNLQ